MLRAPMTAIADEVAEEPGCTGSNGRKRTALMPTLTPLVRHGIDGDRGGEHHHRIMAGRDLDAVRIGDAEPLLGHSRYCGVPVVERVLVVEDVALHVQVRAVTDLDHPAVAKRRDEGLLHHR